MPSTTRSTVTLFVGLGLCAAGAAVPSAAAAASQAPAADQRRVDQTVVAKKKKKKKNVTATVDATWTVKRSGEINGGTESETITFTLKDATAKFKGKNDTNAQGKARIKIVYQGEFLTTDRSYAIGCETEQRTSTATFNSDLDFYVYSTRERTVGGKVQKLPQGWAVGLADPQSSDPRAFRQVTTGFYQEWFSLLQDDCRQYPISTPLGGWNRYFVTSWTATGKLNGGGRGVLLTSANTGVDQTATISGKIRFSENVEKRGTRYGGGSVSLN